ncbi:motility associated factor glycosyltransferase family protein [Paenibacillus thermoaerophilus]|uniref:Motility associated factor glycosyltransferase family protein n=1 Tax=Paenibacillus thermoaerophilus TaxID=1215385 RepID=A0ABW2V9X7_9BACL|nr:6-hydroxymethylpterin diphosphokinase MptE-like protein [Paenibacillus thermoaerophilus]TMV09226.1 motility associated factor glycosyltransferase family protein [Paenibacillus thermoaerophilus]
MPYNENINWIINRFPEIGKFLDVHSVSGRFALAQAKNGMPILLDQQEQPARALNSKYDPVREAELLVRQQKVFGTNMHVCVIGLGMGYHIDALIGEYPDVTFSIYEPSVEMFRLFCESHSFEDWKQRLIHLEIGTENDRLRTFIQSVFQYALNGEQNVHVFALPSHERLFPEEHQLAVEILRDAIQNQRMYLHSNLRYEKLWAVNSMINFEKNLKTANILQDRKEYFKGKPAVIVAAGPSLSYEYEQLRKIKEDGLAYIFSVGSAISGLVENGIYPDAACTYDPNTYNHQVFSKVIDRGIQSIPLVYGSSVGYKTLDLYPGKQLHMITSEDIVSAYLLRKDGKLDFINDASTITVVTLQLLYRLGCNPIILVGQNLAFLQDQFYAEGIRYENRPETLQDSDKRYAMQVEDVYGNLIETNAGFNQMRKDLERYTLSYQHEIEIINTTKGGARIAGTTFMELSEVIRSKLISKHVVNSDWVDDAYPPYDLDFLQMQHQKMNVARKEAETILGEFTKLLQRLEKAIKYRNEQDAASIMAKMDKAITALIKNSFFTTYLLPMNRVHVELLNKDMTTIRVEPQVLKKAEMVAKRFGAVIDACRKDFKEISPLYDRMDEWVRQYTAVHQG